MASGTLDDLRQQARQPFTVWFGGSAPIEELRTVASLHDLEVTHGTEVRGSIEGPPGELLRLLARHDVVHLLLPEPDLEQAFLGYYSDGER